MFIIKNAFVFICFEFVVKRNLRKSDFKLKTRNPIGYHIFVDGAKWKNNLNTVHYLNVSENQLAPAVFLRAFSTIIVGLCLALFLLQRN